MPTVKTSGRSHLRLFEAGMFARGWSPDGKQILYTEAIGHSVNDSTLIIATLHPTRREVVTWDRVNMAKETYSRRGMGSGWEVYPIHE